MFDDHAPSHPSWEFAGNLEETKSLYFIFATRKVSLVTGLRPSQPHLLPSRTSESVVFAPQLTQLTWAGVKRLPGPLVLPSQAPHDKWTCLGDLCAYESLGSTILLKPLFSPYTHPPLTFTPLLLIASCALLPAWQGKGCSFPGSALICCIGLPEKMQDTWWIWVSHKQEIVFYYTSNYISYNIWDILILINYLVYLRFTTNWAVCVFICKIWQP